jgi:DNA-binding NtrC family response regulator
MSAENSRELNYQVLEAYAMWISALSTAGPEQRPGGFALADFVLPGMNGSQLAEQLKARQPKARVLFMTGYSADGTQSISGPAITDTEVLHKPLTHETVERKVRQILNQTG